MEHISYKSTIEKLIDDCELKAKEFEDIGFESSASCSKAMAYAYKNSLDLFYRYVDSSFNLTAIESFIDFLENDIKFDQESTIKNKQLKDILFHEKSRILKKAIFLKKYCDPNNSVRIIDNFGEEELNDKRLNCQHEFKAEKFDCYGNAIQFYCLDCGFITDEFYDK